MKTAMGLGLALLLAMPGCVVYDRDTNRPSAYERLKDFEEAFGKVEKGQSWPEVEGLLHLQFEDSDNIEVRTGPDAIRGLFDERQDIFRGVFDSPEKLAEFFKRVSYRLVIIPWRDVTRRHDRIYFSRQEFSEDGVDDRYLVLFKQEGKTFVVEHLQPARKAIDKHREREAFALILTDLLGLPTIAPDPPDVDIPGLKIKP